MCFSPGGSHIKAYSLIAATRGTLLRHTAASPRLVGLLTAMQRLPGKQLVWRRYFAAGGVAEHVDIDMAEAQAKQPPHSMQDPSSASTAWARNTAASSGVPFGAQMLLDKGRLVACTPETAAAALACAKQGCSTNLYRRLTCSPAPPQPWQLLKSPTCAADEHAPAPVPSGIGSRPTNKRTWPHHCAAHTWGKVAAALAAVCCVQLAALLALLWTRGASSEAYDTSISSPDPIVAALGTNGQLPACGKPGAADSPVHSSARSERSCRWSSRSCCAAGASRQQAAAAAATPHLRPGAGHRAASETVRRLDLELEQASGLAVTWERTGSRLERALVAGSAARSSMGRGAWGAEHKAHGT